MHRKKILFIALVTALLIAASVTALAVYVMNLKKSYSDVTIDDVYSFGTEEGYFKLNVSNPSLTVHAKYDYDVIVSGGTVDGYEAVVTSGDTRVYTIPHNVTSLSVTGGAYNIAVVKHSSRNVYLSSEEDLEGFATFNAVIRNGTYYGDGTTGATEDLSGNYTVAQNTVSLNLRYFYLIADLTLTKDSDICVPFNLNRLWFTLSGNSHTLSVHSPYSGEMRIDGISESGAYTGLSLCNYSGCTVVADAVTVTAGDESVIRTDALRYAQAMIPDCAYRSFSVPDRYLDFEILYTYDNGSDTGAFTGVNSFGNGTRVALTATVRKGDVSGSASGITAFFTERNDYMAYRMKNYTQNISLLIATFLENRITATIHLDEAGPLMFRGGYVLALDAENGTVNGVPFSGNSYELTELCTICRGTSLLFKLDSDPQWHSMLYGNKNAPTPEEAFAGCVYDMYFNANSEIERLYNRVVRVDSATNDGKYYRIQAGNTGTYSTEFYSTLPVASVSYSAYLDIMTAYGNLSGEDWYSYLTNTNLFRPLAFFTYSPTEGQFGLPSATSTTDAHYVFLLDVSYLDEDGQEAHLRYWDDIVFPEGGLTGGNGQYSNISFNVPSYILMSETGADGYIFSLNNEYCRIAPYISAVNGDNSPDVLASFFRCSIDPVASGLLETIQVRDGGIVYSATVGKQYKIVLSDDSTNTDITVTVSVPIYVRGDTINEGGEMEYRLLGVRNYTFTIPAVYSPEDFGNGNSTDGLWIYLKMLEKLYLLSDTPDPFQASAGNAVNGYILKSALGRIDELDCTAYDGCPASMLAVLEYYNKNFSAELTYEELLTRMADTENRQYINSVKGLAYLNNLQRLTLDKLTLSDTDVGIIGNCANLNSISLRNCDLVFSAQQKDINFRSLGNLTELHLDGNNVSDLSDCLAVTLRYLSICNSTSILPVNLAGISDLFALSVLDVSKTDGNSVFAGVKDYTPLSQLSALTEVHLEGNTPNPECANWVYVHLFNHISGIKIYVKNSTEYFTVIGDRDAYETDNGGYTVDADGFVNGSSEMDAEYYELYTSINGVVLMKHYDTEAQFNLEISTLNASSAELSFTGAVASDRASVLLALTKDGISVNKRIFLTVGG